MKKLLALLMALTLTFQLVTPVFADTEEAETTAATEAVLETASEERIQNGNLWDEKAPGHC